MAIAKSITGRDGYILCQALCYAIETIKRLPDRWQEASNAEDMQRILDAMFSPRLIDMCRESARYQLDGAKFDPAINDEDEDDPETVEAEADLAFRIANYLKLNGFKNLAEAEAKGWGDTRPLTDRPNGGTA